MLDDDDDVIAAPPTTFTAPAQSPSASLRDMTPAMSVSTTSGHSSDIANGAHANSSSISGGEAELDPISPLDEHRTGYVFSADMMLHVNPIEPEHPERPLRIWKIFLEFKRNNLFPRMKRIPIREVEEEEVALVHDKGIWDGVKRSACKC